MYNINAQQSNYSPQSWYSLYAKAYQQGIKNGHKNCPPPSIVKSELASLGCGTNAIQLVHMICDVQLPINSEGPSDGENQGSDGSENGGTVTRSVMSCGLIIPNNKIFNEDCTVDLHFPEYIICDGLRSDNPNSVQGAVRSVSIKADGRPLIKSISYGQTVTLNLLDIFQRELEFEVSYKSGTFDKYNFDTKNSPRLSYPKHWESGFDDSFVLYPPCIGPPPVTCDNCPPPDTPINPRNGDDNECWIQGSDPTSVIATIPFVDHLPGGPLYTYEYDYRTYSTDQNDAVDEGPDGSNKYGVVIRNDFINPNRDKIKKPIIVCDGIDFPSNRFGPAILNEELTSATVQKLYENDFDIIIADFKGGADFMQKNAFALIELIKQVQEEIGPNNDIEAIVGPSMGGQITRYALLYWENEVANGNPKFTEDYRIKTFISADSPWLGANASPAIQSLANIGKDKDSDFNTSLEEIDKLPNSPAARQLLVNHVHGIKVLSNHYCDLTFWGFKTWKKHNYNGIEHPFKTAWDAEIEMMGSVPTKLKNGIVAVADGAGNGNASGIVQPGDPILSITGSSLVGLANYNINMNAIKNGDHLIDINYSGPGICVLFGTIGTTTIPVTSETIPDFDSYPGSPFRLSNYLAGAGLSGINIENDFQFIPTYSALGIKAGEGNPDLDIIGDDVQSDFFDDYFVDDTNSGHNEFLQEGTLDFVLKNLDTEETDLDACWYLEQLVGESFLCSDSDNNVIEQEIFVEIEYSPYGYETYDEEHGITDYSFEGLLDMRLFDENNNIVEPVVEITPIGNSCPGGLYYNSDSNSLNVRFRGEQYYEDGCDYGEYEVCITHPLCPDVEIQCETIIIDLDIEESYTGSTRPLVEDNEAESKERLTTDQTTNSTHTMENVSKFKIYPNPSTGQINATLDKGYNVVSIFNIDGRLINEYHLKDDKLEFKTNLAKGAYIIRVFNIETNSLSINKIIII